jgi:hypothetical protein
MTVEISLLIAMVGCFIGLAGYLSGRDKKIHADGEWKGEVNTQLRLILDNTSGVSNRVDDLEDKVNEHGERLSVVETSINRLEGKR